MYQGNTGRARKIVAARDFSPASGGWMFGRIADKVGRKQSMTLSVLLMSLDPLLIALTPTYQTVGIVAPVMLLTARLPHALTVAVFGGTAEYIALGCKRAGHESYFYWYLAACIGTSLLLLLLLPKTRLPSQFANDGG